MKSGNIIVNENMHLEVVKYFMVLTGIWQIRRIGSPILRKIYMIFAFLPKLYMILFVISQFIDIPILWKVNAFAVAENLGMSILYFVTMIKVFIFQSKPMQKLYDIVVERQKYILNGTDEAIKKIYLSHARHAIGINIYYCSFSVFIITVYDIVAYIQFILQFDENLLATNETYVRPLPFVSWFPFDTNQYYTAAFVIDAITCHYGGYFFISTQCMLVGLIIYIIGQLKILQHFMRDLENYIKLDCQKYQKPECEVAINTIIGFIKEHNKTIRCVEELNECIKYIILFEFLINSLQIATLLFQLMTTEPTIFTAFTVTYSTIMVSQLFILYWHGNEIQVQSLAVADAIFECEWINQSEEVKRCVRMIIQRSQRPLAITIGPFYQMSASTVILTLKASYSYVMLLRESYKRKAALAEHD